MKSMSLTYKMKKITLKVCKGQACRGRFSDLTKQRAIQEKEKHDLKNIAIESTPCQSQCEHGPIVVYEKGTCSEALHEITPIRMGQLIKKLR